MTLRLFGATFSTASAGEVIAAAAAATSPRPRLVVTANVDHIVTLAESAAFRKAYEGAVARTLERAGAEGFCVALLEEAVELRDAGVRAPILVMGGYYGGA